LIAAIDDHLFFFLCDSVFFLEFFLQALTDLGEAHFGTAGQAVLLSFLAHLAVEVDQTLGSELLLDKLAPEHVEVSLLDGEQVLVRQVNAQALLEHGEGFSLVVLDDLLACVVVELVLHLEGLLQALSEGFPQLRAYARLDAHSLLRLALAALLGKSVCRLACWGCLWAVLVVRLQQRELWQALRYLDKVDILLAAGSDQRELLQHRVKHEQRILPTIPLVLRALEREEQVLVLLQVLQAGSVLVYEVVLLGGLLLLSSLRLGNLSMRRRSRNQRRLSGTGFKAAGPTLQRVLLANGWQRMLLLLWSSLRIACLAPLVLQLSELLVLLQALLELHPLLEVLQLLQHCWSPSFSSRLQTGVRVDLRRYLVRWWLVFWHCKAVSTP
jgi:hypothetical protein